MENKDDANKNKMLLGDFNCPMGKIDKIMEKKRVSKQASKQARN